MQHSIHFSVPGSRFVSRFGVMVLSVAGLAHADVRLPALFSDHAVLQAGKPVNVWGWASPGEAVHVEIAGTSADTKAGEDGKWAVRLAPLAAGGPHALAVRGNNTLRINDVLIGEVWLCSGQSNMAMQLKGLHGEVNNANAVIAKADHPTLRQFVHDAPYSLRMTALPPAVPQADRPGKWVVCTPDTAAKFTAFGYFFARQLQDQLDAPVGLINAAVGGTTIETWTSLPAQEAAPELKPLLADWQRRLEPYDPIAEKKAANTARAAWLQQRAVAVETGQTEPKAPREADYKNLTINGPAGLFNGTLAPLIPYTMRGALWYQGERNASGKFTSLYGRQLEVLIADWRARWGDDFYFSYVQIPNYQKPQTLPSDDKGWAVWVRDGQRATWAKVPNTAMAVTIDLGGITPEFLHPKNKDEFARRSAVLALHDVYQKPTAMRSGPLFREAKRVGNTFELSFDFADGLGTEAGSTKPQGFAIAGPDRNFVWANAEIRDGRIAVWSDRITDPEAVRYGWSANPIGNVRNSAGLPCSPFRTDDWPAQGVAPAAAVD